MATADPRANIKARLVTSLFNTRGEDGQLVEQYITHVKISEDPAYPSSQPPPGAENSSSKKQRCIVVSVQRNGVVRLHKTRENNNGTFSIGKTWAMDQLEKLEETDTLGFIITIQKPYYWTAETAKDKYAFVTALVQVYRKFTGGKTPEIVGFESIFRQSGSQSSRQTPPANAYATSSRSSSLNQYANTPPPPSNPYTNDSPAAVYATPSTSNPYANAPRTSDPYANPSSSNPYATSPPSQTSYPNPYATQSDPYANSSQKQIRRQPSDLQDRTQRFDRVESRASDRSSPERPKSRDKARDIPPRDPNGTPLPVVAPLNISRQTSNATLRGTPSISSTTSVYDNPPRKRMEEDQMSTSSRSARSTAPRPTQALKASPIPAQRIVDKPGSGRSTPDTQTTTPKPSSRHNPKLSISTATTVVSKTNGVSPPETARAKSPRKRPRSIDEMGPSEETISAAMLEIENLLTSFDWTHPTPCATRLEQLLTEELENVESENVHALVMNDTPDMNGFVERLDAGIKECEELDEMLTLYLVELQALADDVNFIESENRGLHVRTANERALEKELAELLKDMSISPMEFDVLKQESLEKLDGIETIQASLVQVYRALKASSGLDDQDHSESPLENMRIVKEMRQSTQQETEKFLARLKEFVKIKFQAELMAIPSAKKTKAKPVFPDHTTSYSYFYRYAALVLFAKEVNQDSYLDIRQLYLSPASKSYKEDFRIFVAQWKTIGRKATSEDHEFIFSLVKEHQGAVSAVRSATIRRTGTVAKTLRSPMSDGLLRGEKERERQEQEGKIPVGEIFAAILSAIVPAATKEQSFAMEFLHLSPSISCGKCTYEEFLKRPDPVAWTQSLEKKRPQELNKIAAKETLEAMEQLLSWLPDELSSLIDWCKTQLIGVLGALEKHINEWEDTDQTFLTRTLQKQHDKLGGIFHRFIEEQTRAIEDMKVTAKKRQGVLLMFKIFPGFVERIEAQFKADYMDSTLDVRDTVNEAYGSISKTMFDSLQAIARDTSSHHNSGTKDDEDKELLNSHISMVENMHYYRETVDSTSNPILTKYKTQAQNLLSEHLGLYTKAVIRRPLGKLLDFLQGVETFVQSNPSEDVTARISFSKSAFKKVLSHYDTKELRKGIDLLHKRVDKHFGQASDDSDSVYNQKQSMIAKDLVREVWKECQKEYVGIVELCQRIISIYYPEGVQMDFSLGDVNDAFSKRI